MLVHQAAAAWHWLLVSEECKHGLFHPPVRCYEKMKEFLSLALKRKAEAGSWLAAELLLCLGAGFI